LRQKLFILSLLLVTLVIPLVTSAQNPPARLLINYPEVAVGSGDTTALGLYFTVLDRSGLAVSGSGAGSAVIVMDTGNRYDAEVSAPTTPLNILLLLDMSGSMGEAAPAMKTAAIQAIQTAPEGTRFQVMTFNQQITVVQPFTSERNAVINVIAGVNPPPRTDPNAGTCLYDALIQSLAEMDSVPLPNRRTIVLFTDGRDELTRGGAVCSRFTYNDVLDRATRIDDPIAINTIGLSGDRAINEDELRDLANTTGGIAAIGETTNLTDLFGQIINGLASQQVARAEICEPAGARSATLTINAGGQLLTESVAFQNARGCAIATAVPTVLIIRGVQFNNEREELSFRIDGQGQENVAEYRIDVYDRNDNLVLTDVQTSSQILFDASRIPDGQVTIDILAVNSSGIILAQVDGTTTIERPVPTATPTLAPTETPAPTNTPAPVSASIESIDYLETSDSININLRFLSPEQITDLQVDITDRNGFRIPLNPAPVIDMDAVRASGLIAVNIASLSPQNEYTIEIRTFQNGQLVNSDERQFINPKLPPPTIIIGAGVDSIEANLAENQVILNLDVQGGEIIDRVTIQLRDANDIVVRSFDADLDNRRAIVDLVGLVSEAEYQIRVVALDASGGVLSRETAEFVNPAPVNTTAIVIGTTRTDPLQQNFIIPLTFQNGGAIQQVVVEIINNDLNSLTDSRSFALDTIENGELFVPIDNLRVGDGEYRLRIIARDADGRDLAESTQVIGYTRNTPTPTPEPPSFVQQLGKVIADQPIVGVIIGIIVLLLVFLLFWLVRSARQREKNLKQPSLPNMTGAISISELRQGMQNMGYTPPPYGVESSNQDMPYGEQPTGNFMIYGDATNVPSAYDPNMTNAEISMSMAGLAEESTNVFLPATLTITDSLDTSMIGATAVIGKVLFWIGRSGKRENDLNIEHDKNVSREHADIIFDGGAYYIIDKPNTHGVEVNDEVISGRYPLGARATIKLGKTTVIEFEMTSNTSKTASF